MSDEIDDEEDDNEPIELPESTPLFFNEGCVFDNDYVVVASQMDEFSDSAVSRVSLIKNAASSRKPEWLYLDFKDAATSVTGVVEESGQRTSYFMGIYGKVLVTGGGDWHVEDVPYEDKHGRLLRTRTIGRTVLICGMSGQLLARTRGVWRRIDGGLLGTDRLDFEDIDGSSLTDLYAVGVEGAIYHFDGKKWRDTHSPTNRSLSSVRCVSNDDVYVCGDAGLLLHGNARRGWRVLAEDCIDDNLWGLALYKRRPYVASSGGIYVYDGEDLKLLDTGDVELTSINRLDATPDGLWSFGIKQIAWFDGEKWHEVICPPNV